MKVPLEIAFKGIEHTDEIEALIQEEADKLERVCHYMIQLPGRRRAAAAASGKSATRTACGSI